jgi:hypothetical protein
MIAVLSDWRLTEAGRYFSLLLDTFGQRGLAVLVVRIFEDDLLSPDSHPMEIAFPSNFA